MQNDPANPGPLEIVQTSQPSRDLRGSKRCSSRVLSSPKTFILLTAFNSRGELVFRLLLMSFVVESI